MKRYIHSTEYSDRAIAYQSKHGFLDKPKRRSREEVEAENVKWHAQREYIWNLNDSVLPNIIARINTEIIDPIISEFNWTSHVYPYDRHSAEFKIDEDCIKFSIEKYTDWMHYQGGIFWAASLASGGHGDNFHQTLSKVPTRQKRVILQMFDQIQNILKEEGFELLAPAKANKRGGFDFAVTTEEFDNLL